MRDRVQAAQPDTWRLAAEQAERGPHGPDHEMVLAGRRGLPARAGHLDVQPAAGDPRLHHVVQASARPSAVETGPEVGAGRRGAGP